MKKTRKKYTTFYDLVDPEKRKLYKPKNVTRRKTMPSTRKPKRSKWRVQNLLPQEVGPILDTQDKILLESQYRVRCMKRFMKDNENGGADNYEKEQIKKLRKMDDKIAYSYMINWCKKNKKGGSRRRRKRSRRRTHRRRTRRRRKRRRK